MQMKLSYFLYRQTKDKTYVFDNYVRITMYFELLIIIVPSCFYLSGLRVLGTVPSLTHPDNNHRTSISDLTHWVNGRYVTSTVVQWSDTNN